MQVLNWQFVKHPMNWIIVVMMLVIAGIAGHLILQLAGFEPASAE